MTRLLYILPGLVPPFSDPAHDALTYLSEIAEGEVLLPVWWRSADSAPEWMRATFPLYRVGNFRYHLTLAYRYPERLRFIVKFFFYLRRGLQLHREKRFDVIMTYGTNIPGIAGVILKWLTGARLIVEIPGVPENAFRFDVPNPGKHLKLKRLLADVLLNFVGAAADCLRLFYPGQLQDYRRLKKKKSVAFHGFVPVRLIESNSTGQNSVLSVGFPWHTKGMDLLIRAFVSIASRFPECKLRLMGYFPDRSELDRLACGCQQIEFVKPGPYEAALKTISDCSVFVLASRTESMGRVLLEAMAARKPVIASAVGGIPHYIRDNDNGLLFQSQNVEDLAAKLAAVLSSAELRTRLADRGYQRVMAEYDEHTFVRSFQRMLQAVGQDLYSSAIS
jgi:glycosyltransferase involved in cell wall biosynthesis